MILRRCVQVKVVFSNMSLLSWLNFDWEQWWGLPMVWLVKLMDEIDGDAAVGCGDSWVTRVRSKQSTLQTHSHHHNVIFNWILDDFRVWRIPCHFFLGLCSCLIISWSSHIFIGLSQRVMMNVVHLKVARDDHGGSRSSGAWAESLKVSSLWGWLMEFLPSNGA